MSSRKRWIIILIASAVVVAALIFAFFATWLGWWPVVVDITLVITALASLALLCFLIYATLSLTRTALRIRDELIPTLDALKATSATVRETAKTASAFGVAPAMRTASAVLGATSVASAILGRGEARTRSERRQKRRLELEREIERDEREADEARASLAASDAFLAQLPVDGNDLAQRPEHRNGRR